MICMYVCTFITTNGLMVKRGSSDRPAFRIVNDVVQLLEESIILFSI